MTYRAPLRDMLFALEDVAGANTLKDAFPDYSGDLARQVLEQADRLASDVLAPLNHSGDKEGSRLENGVVRTPEGFAGAYSQFRDAGWMGLPFPEEWGGQGLPRGLALSVHEMFHAANMSFALCPMLTLGAIEALLAHGSPDLQALYLPKLVSGEWTGTMNLTEPQAGSDVGAVASKAWDAGDGSYRVQGTKIYITWGDHDVAENIIHLVLARLPGAPAGTKGLSLFLVPKFLPTETGKPGLRNDLKPIGVEHKLGIHASPTCTMSFGEQSGAKGWLIGAAGAGMAAMFTMMNSARLNVGLQGVAIGERAYQRALAYAVERRQGRAHDETERGSSRILDHADVRRMLMTMKAKTEAARAICYLTAVSADLAEHGKTETEQARAKRREELLTPIAKAWSTDVGVEAASLGVQVHGGMGFVEETGAAQYYRDARIAPIYEGTNGIQAIDLAGRKLAMEGGQAFEDLLADIAATVADLARSANPEVAALAPRLKAGHAALMETGRWLREAMVSRRGDALAGATPFLRLAGDVTGGWLLCKGALAAQNRIALGDLAPDYAWGRINLARFYAETTLAAAPGLASDVRVGARLVFALSERALGVA
jgi:alkylation response protein AidB-like acyl-CoA dehydrogenase